MGVLVAAAVTTLVVVVVLRHLLRAVEQAERTEADPVGPVRLTAAERQALADLERRCRRRPRSRRNPVREGPTRQL